MSLDVYLTMHKSRAFADVQRALVAAHGEERADALLADLGVKADEATRVYDANITHNLTTMAAAAGVYEACWRPHLLLATPDERAVIEQNVGAHDHPLFAKRDAVEREVERRADGAITARLLIEPLQKGLDTLEGDPERFRPMAPENGWGDYRGLVRFVGNYLEACRQFPNAIVSVSR